MLLNEWFDNIKTSHAEKYACMTQWVKTKATFERNDSTTLNIPYSKILIFAHETMSENDIMRIANKFKANVTTQPYVVK